MIFKGHLNYWNSTDVQVFLLEEHCKYRLINFIIHVNDRRPAVLPITSTVVVLDHHVPSREHLAERTSVRLIG